MKIPTLRCVFNLMQRGVKMRARGLAAVYKTSR